MAGAILDPMTVVQMSYDVPMINIFSNCPGHQGFHMCPGVASRGPALTFASEGRGMQEGPTPDLGAASLMAMMGTSCRVQEVLRLSEISFHVLLRSKKPWGWRRLQRVGGI